MEDRVCFYVLPAAPKNEKPVIQNKTDRPRIHILCVYKFMVCALFATTAITQQHQRRRRQQATAAAAAINWMSKVTSTVAVAALRSWMNRQKNVWRLIRWHDCFSAGRFAIAAHCAMPSFMRFATFIQPPKRRALPAMCYLLLLVIPMANQTRVHHTQHTECRRCHYDDAFHRLICSSLTVSGWAGDNFCWFAILM